MNFCQPTAAAAEQLLHSSFNKGDIIVMTTRPPIDGEDKERLIIPRSNTLLEMKILNSLKKYFRYCSRQQVTIEEPFSKHFIREYDDRAHIEYPAHGRHIGNFSFARYTGTIGGDSHHKQWMGDDLRTAFYCLYVREIWENGPDLLVSFGMTGACGLIWAYCIRTKYPYLLNSPRIAVAEMRVEMNKIPIAPPSLSFIDELDIKLILNHEIDTPACLHSSD